MQWCQHCGVRSLWFSPGSHLVLTWFPLFSELSELQTQWWQSTVSFLQIRPAAGGWTSKQTLTVPCLYSGVHAGLAHVGHMCDLVPESLLPGQWTCWIFSPPPRPPSPPLTCIALMVCPPPGTMVQLLMVARFVCEETQTRMLTGLDSDLTSSTNMWPLTLCDQVIALVLDGGLGPHCSVFSTRSELLIWRESVQWATPGHNPQLSSKIWLHVCGPQSVWTVMMWTDDSVWQEPGDTIL